MERDPHQLIEGCLIACYAAGLSQCFLYIRGEMALRPGAGGRGAQRGVRGRLRRSQHPGLRAQRRHLPALGSRCLHRGRGDRADRVARGQPGHAPAQAAVLPRRHRPVRPADDRQQRGDAVEPALADASTVSRPTSATARRPRPAPASSPSPATSRRPGVYEVQHGITTFRDLFYDEQFCRGMRASGRELKMFIPGGGSAPWFFPEQLDLPLEARPVGAAGSMLGSGALVVMDDTVDAVVACLRVVRFFARESCGKCTPCREGTNWLEKILQRHARRPRPSRRHRPAARRRRQHQPRPLPGRRLRGRGPGRRCRSRPARPRSARSGRRRWPRWSAPSAASGPSSRPGSPVGRSRSRSTSNRSSRRRLRRRPASPPMSDDRQARRRPTAAQDDADRHRRRARRSRRSRASWSIDAAERTRHLHPAVLLPQPHALRRHVPHVPGRDRRRPGPGPAAGLHDLRGARA